jgi:CMP/dCMP kinase
VRAALLDVQRNLAKDPRGAVLDGRDIGTVVCPDAKYKFFITASLDARAERRFKELQKQDGSVIYAAVLEELKARDARDQKRKISPLVPANGAIHIDTTGLGMDEVFYRVCSHVELA